MISIIVPTLKEAANLPVLAQRIAGAMMGAAFEILVVDDTSRDGTPEICQRLAERYPLRLEVRHTPADGLAGAVLHGFAVAWGDILVVMDADLQHPPEAIPQLIAPLLCGAADFVLGSRRVDRGGVADGWGIWRRLNSTVARLLAAPLVGRIKDPMSGFFAVGRESLADTSGFHPVGYKIALELVCRCHFRRIVEVPIEFGVRLRGRSKLTGSQRFNYIRHLARLYLLWLREHWRPSCRRLEPARPRVLTYDAWRARGV